jgi:glycosyltransferase EpsE
MCDDGSTDLTFSIAKSYADKYPNIMILKNAKNMGLSYTLNQCLKYAKGDYIARQDGDDISLKERFQIQIEKLIENPDLSIVSSTMIYFDENETWLNGIFIEYPKPIDLVKGTPFCHAASMIEKSALIDVGGYRNLKYILRVEDYDLWFRMYAKGYRGSNIKQPLYMMRDDRNARARRKFKYRFNETI